MNVGQTCIAPDYVMVHKNAEHALYKALVKTIEEFFGKDIQKNKDYSRIINEKHTKRLIKLIEAVKDKKNVYGGKYDIQDKYIEPTIIQHATKDDLCMQDEVYPLTR
jgi:aldehyde dehydrogenase (NAD+)